MYMRHAHVYGPCLCTGDMKIYQDGCIYGPSVKCTADEPCTRGTADKYVSMVCVVCMFVCVFVCMCVCVCVFVFVCIDW